MSQAIMPTYARADLAFERGEGSYLYTADGRRFLDFAAGIAVNSLGHSHPRLVQALQDQAGKLWHVSNLYQIPDGQRLAEKLTENSFADRVFFANSGAEAVEGAMKVARRYHYSCDAGEKRGIITCRSSFHGRTMTTLSAAKNEKHLEGFGGVSPDFDQVAFGNLNELRTAINETTAAVLVEPIQGEGGIRPAELDYLRGLRATCDEFGLLLIFDEVQCGMGRTGKLFAYEWAGIEPDVMALAKGLGSGFPMGAVLASEKAAAGMVPGTHGSTFGGNPLAMAVGNAVLDVMLEEGFLENVSRQGEALRAGCETLIANHPSVFAEVRGTGLMLGLRCHEKSGRLVELLRDEGLLTVGAAEEVVRLLPPLTIGQAEIDEALAALSNAAAKLSAES